MLFKDLLLDDGATTLTDRSLRRSRGHHAST
jgi:hypothetical protein